MRGFAERLLDSKRVAPDLKASNLFALVAYKMFHMKDFEKSRGIGAAWITATPPH